MSRPPRLLWAMILIATAQLIQVTSGSGFFELQILEIANYRGGRASGECCGAAPTALSPSGRYASLTPTIGTGGAASVCRTSPRPCATMFRLCLKEFQRPVSPGLASAPGSAPAGCSFGNASTPVVGGTNFAVPEPYTAAMVLPFTFRWTRQFTLVLQALDFYNATYPASEHLIVEATYSGIIDPSTAWSTLEWGPSLDQRRDPSGDRGVRLTYRVRVQCDRNYYNATCTKFCRPRDDKFGHYTCDSLGDKECLPGWQGANCETAACKAGCHPVHGKCDRPGECECRPGWRGPQCDECTPYPGCIHGYCNGSAWQCICDTNWGGILCDQDLNYCGTHEPCLHGGTCENTAPDQYLCSCAEGLSGRHCEIVDNPCAPQPCRNGGTCQERPGAGGASGSYQCRCDAGWEGPNCETNIDDCIGNPCEHGGTCVDLVGGFRCECPSEWTGEHCETDVDECLSSPCANAVSCTNSQGGFLCTCAAGWGGALCNRNIDDCVGQCLNGATCIDLVDDYHCACAAGYTGRDCATDVDECQAAPCRHGGECVDLVGGFRCICPVGRSGTLCEDDIDRCAPNPCQNGAECLNTPGGYYCHCPGGLTGRHCEGPRHSSISNDECSPNPCQNNGTCLLGGPSGAGFTCLCPAGTRGRLCSDGGGLNAGDDCEPTGRCLNGGVCDTQRGRCNCPAGWAGAQCGEPLDQCHGEPCHNGGKCVGGPGWFRCECSRGFSGPDCRINVNECASNPCRGGAACRDRIGGYTCLCPPGRAGERCEIETSGSGCWAPPNSTWSRGCNTCTCSQGIQRCSNLWCGLQDCLGANATECAPHEVCVPAPQESCLSPPCIARGDCRALEPSRRVAPPALPTSPDCWPNQAVLGEQCARVSVLLESGRAPRGGTVEALCSALRSVLGSRLIKEPSTDLRSLVVVLCEMKTGVNDTIEVTVSSPPGGHTGAEIVALSVRLLGELISRGVTSTDGVLPAAIREVKVETALLSSETQGGGYLIALICIMAVVLLVGAVLGTFMLRQRIRGRSISGMGLTPSPSDAFRAEEEKSNNLQNEENFRRYANPLKEERPALGGSLGSLRGLTTSSIELSPKVSVVELHHHKSSGDLNPNVGLVRPMTGEPLAGPSNTTAQDIIHEYNHMLHKSKSLNPDLVQVEADMMHVDCNLKSAHRNSQILLYKAQNSDMKKNTTGTFDNSNKDFGKRSINITTATNHGDSDVLTVLV